MPRKRRTRGIQYEALEFLFGHLYEKVLEEQLKEHLLKVKGRLQQKGDPVKSAINLAIKELQRLHEPTFEILKIQEASLVGKTKRYVQLNFTGFNDVVNYEQYVSYLQDILLDEEMLVLRSMINLPPYMEQVVFPGLTEEHLQRIRSYSLINFFPAMEGESLAEYYYIPDNCANLNLLLLYENEETEEPFMAFLSNLSTAPSLEDSEFIMLRGEDKRSKLDFLHRMWSEQKSMALNAGKTIDLWQKSDSLFKKLKKANIQDDEYEISRTNLFNCMLNLETQNRRMPREERRS